MSRLSFEDEAELQSFLKQLLGSINDKISCASSTECAEEILLHLEETDKNFHNYEFVKYLRRYVENSLGAVVDEETKNVTGGEGQHAVGSGHDALIYGVTNRTRDSAEYRQMMESLKNSMTVVVESLINKFEEDQQRKEMYREREYGQSNSQFTDNCSDSDSSFNQSYAFIRQEQLQVLAEKLDSNKPKEVRKDALRVLCGAPPSDVLSCESWSTLRRNLCAALNEPHLNENVLQFFAKSFSSSPLNVTREIYTSLAQSVESSFRTLRLSFPSGSATIDTHRPEITRLLKQIRLMNDFQKEVTTYWIRHPEKYMEEVIESTFSLLCFHHEQSASETEKILEPIHLLALLDIKATWFNKWTHGYYSRTVVLRLLERKYKSLIVAALQQCVCYSESCERVSSEPNPDPHPGETRDTDPVGLTDLVVILITIMYRHPNPPGSDPSLTDSLSPSSLVMEVLCTLCDWDQCAAECLHQASVVEALLAPITALLSGQQVKLKSPVSTLTLVADVLARIANTDRGLALFLYEKNLIGAQGERTSAAHVIVQFTLRLLDEALPPLSQSQALCGAFIFVCRQIYNTCEGLQVLRPYGLHEAIAAAWRKVGSVSERGPTPVKGSTQETTDLRVWEETLLDSLLNFAATPRGLTLLHQTGALPHCVSHMFSRLTKKLQVSRCEKFGYGVMVTQVAATAPGVAALQASGFVRMLVAELWSAVECGSDDVRVVQPRPTPMDPIDRSCLKPFLSLVNLLSSSQSVVELLGRQPLANKSAYSLRETPTSIPDLIDRLIAVNSDVKIHSLFHYEQSHTFGLRLLSVLCCSLDSLLLLQSQYGLSSALLHSQGDNMADPDLGDRSIIIDALSVERNHVLVRAGLVGGPSERRLPPRALKEGEDPYPWPMFSSYPPPAVYSLDPPDVHHNSQDSEISRFLATSKDQKTEDGWLEILRRQFCRAMMSKPNSLTGKVLANLMEKVVSHLSSSATDCFFSPAQYKAKEKNIKDAVLSPVERLGMDTCLRYGLHLRLLREDSAGDLEQLMKHIKIFLSTQRVDSPSALFTKQDGYPGHDWLLSTVFLITAGNAEQSLGLLLKLSSLLASAFLWPARIHESVHLPRSGVPPVYWCTAHYVEMLLKAEVPLVHSAFRMSGFTPSQMCLQWLTQCFWNYLDWTEICHYVCTCVLMGPDYQVYLCVAIFKHLQPDILQCTQSQELQVFLKEEPILGFKFSNYVEFMLGLEHSYRNVVLTDMNSIKSPVQ